MEKAENFFEQPHTHHCKNIAQDSVFIFLYLSLILFLISLLDYLRDIIVKRIAVLPLFSLKAAFCFAHPSCMPVKPYLSPWNSSDQRVGNIWYHEQFMGIRFSAFCFSFKPSASILEPSLFHQLLQWQCNIFCMYWVDVFFIFHCKIALYAPKYNCKLPWILCMKVLHLITTVGFPLYLSTAHQLHLPFRYSNVSCKHMEMFGSWNFLCLL